VNFFSLSQLQVDYTIYSPPGPDVIDTDVRVTSRPMGSCSLTSLYNSFEAAENDNEYYHKIKDVGDL
jgi:hypothetical protein